MNMFTPVRSHRSICAMKCLVMTMYSVGDLVLLQGWRVGMIVGVEGTGFTEWVQVLFPDAGAPHWVDAQRLQPLSSDLLPTYPPTR